MRGRSGFGPLSGVTWMTPSSHFTSLRLCVLISITGMFLADLLGQGSYHRLFIHRGRVFLS